jgi:dTDP-4-amino-4,6-dideoxygalactose transaminase
LFYKDVFKEIKKAVLFDNTNEDFLSNYWLNTVLLENKKDRENLRIAFDVANIESRPLWKPMHLQPLFEKYPYYGNKIAEELFDRGLCLPSGSNLTIKDKSRIKEVLINFFKKNIN